MVKDVAKGPTSGGNKEKGLLLKATVRARWPRRLTVHPWGLCFWVAARPCGWWGLNVQEVSLRIHNLSASNSGLGNGSSRSPNQHTHSCLPAPGGETMARFLPENVTEQGQVPAVLWRLSRCLSAAGPLGWLSLSLQPDTVEFTFGERDIEEREEASSEGSHPPAGRSWRRRVFVSGFTTVAGADGRRDQGMECRNLSPESLNPYHWEEWDSISTAVLRQWTSGVMHVKRLCKLQGPPGKDAGTALSVHWEFCIHHLI